MITVHHLNNSRSQRILWLLEELGLDYTIKHYLRDPKTMLAPDDLRAVHPLGKSPVITDTSSGETVSVAESGAIIEYLIETYGAGRLRPASGTPAARRYTFWMHYAEGSLMPAILVNLVVSKIESAPVPFFIRPIVKGIGKQVRKGFLNRQLKGNADYLEAELARAAWFAGDEFSAADIQMSFPVEALVARGADDLPRCASFLKRIHARPAYQRAVERGGAYDLASFDR